MKKITLLTLLALVLSAPICTASNLRVKVNTYGELADAVGDRLNDIDSIWVEGPIDSTDIRTLWNASFHGKLVYINLSTATVKNHRIPPYAFYNPSEQNLPEYWVMLPLKEIVLPDDITEIGNSAFAWSLLERINMPASLEKLGIYAFYQCWNLAVSPLVIPEGVEVIPGNCFTDCHSLREVVLPSTIKVIDQVAFYNARITQVNLPEGLDSIGMAAFSGNHIEHLTLPASCSHVGFEAFSDAVELKRLTFSEGATIVPRYIACSNRLLETVDLPSTIEEIEDMAFMNCPALKNAVLPEGLKRIGDAAFRYCSGIDSLAIPASVESIGRSAFMDMPGLKAIWSESPAPPQCLGTWDGNDISFGGATPFNIPVYVPVGSADLYHDANGWNYFFGYIETNDFPTAVKTALVSGGLEMCGRDGRLEIRNQGAPTRFAVYSISGKLMNEGTAEHGQIQVALPRGMYVVKAGGATAKVAVR